MTHLLSFLVELLRRIWNASVQPHLHFLEHEKWCFSYYMWGDEEPNVQPGVLDCRWNRQHQWLEKWPASLWAEAAPSAPPGEDKPGTLKWQFSSNAFPTTPHLVGKAFIFPQLDLSFHQICSQLAKRVVHKLAGILCLVSWQEGEVCYNWVP